MLWLTEAAIPFTLVLLIANGESLSVFPFYLMNALLLVFIVREAGRAAVACQEREKELEREIAMLKAFDRGMKQSQFN